MGLCSQNKLLGSSSSASTGMNIKWNSQFSFSGKCEQNCLELTWHPYGESKPCDPGSLFSVDKRWELGWEEIYLSYWRDLGLRKVQCSCIDFYLSPYKVMRSLVASEQARAKSWDKEQTMKRPPCQKQSLNCCMKKLKIVFYNDKYDFCSTWRNWRQQTMPFWGPFSVKCAL